MRTSCVVADTHQLISNYQLPTRTRDKLHGRNIELPSPPICEAKPEVKINIHGDEVVDNYAWLKDRENPDGKETKKNYRLPPLPPFLALSYTADCSLQIVRLLCVCWLHIVTVLTL